MSHVYINPTHENTSLWHCPFVIDLMINTLMHPSINDNTSIHLHLWIIWKHIDQSIEKNDNTYFINILWQDIVPLTSIFWHQWQHDPTISPFGIDGNTNIDVNTNHWWKHVDKAFFYINSHLNHINVTISPPLTSMKKGSSLLGDAPLSWTLLRDAPPVWMPLSFL